MTLAGHLQRGLSEMQLDLQEETRFRLLDYLALLTKWNATFNLTAIRDSEQMLIQHVLDSLSVLCVLKKSVLAGRRWADVGSGAGLPGIPLAIVCPELSMSLVETVEKKTAFQRQAKIELGLANLEVVGGRVEQLPAGGFDAVISRAFASLAEFASLAGHLVRQPGRLYAMKGRLPEKEIEQLPTSWHVAESFPLRVPGLDAQRCLIVLEKE
ncbi:MAG: 16S rRNA (guanine(527)-N(7))-methyltransferase RsmG [Betaproteobacteria bacterium HGW-Betaproteobacteria-11]|nr:MAG: 16S rRNA (guanine(527)-N(7))-methyltransferase RsmG [Betaproteobacteria bacterium HGW-Betaproteobacteria-11]